MRALHQPSLSQHAWIAPPFCQSASSGPLLVRSPDSSGGNQELAFQYADQPAESKRVLLTGGGGGKKFKPKVVFRQQSMVVSDRHGRASSDNSPPPDEIGGKADEEMDEFMAESQLIYHDKESEEPENSIVPFEPAHKHDSKGNSMVDFLYSFEESSKQLEENHRNLKLAMPTRTMADQFHEAFGMVDVIDERPHVTFSRPSCNGKYGKLQEAIQSEKEKDMGYLNSLSAEPGFKDERMCISVRILTRALEAKLIVCSCSRVEDGKVCMLSDIRLDYIAWQTHSSFNNCIC